MVISPKFAIYRNIRNSHMKLNTNMIFNHHNGMAFYISKFSQKPIILHWNIEKAVNTFWDNTIKVGPAFHSHEELRKRVKKVVSMWQSKFFSWMVLLIFPLPLSVKMALIIVVFFTCFILFYIKGFGYCSPTISNQSFYEKVIIIFSKFIRYLNV